jgi:hypothetical protein
MTAKPRKHRNNRARITAAERVDGYARFVFGDQGAPRLDGADRAYLLKMLCDHARETLARERRRKAGK